METRKLGQDLSVSALGYGCMGLSHAYGEALDEKEAVRVLREAFEAGYTFFDTAEVYGTEDDPHVNERLVGEALKEVRDKVQIATKFGIRFDLASSKRPYPLIPDSRPETIRRSVEGSLKRLRTDHIDLYFQHRIDPQVEPEIVAGVMADLIKEGKILHWGISEANKNYLRRAHAVCPVTAVENRYSMMVRHYEALFPVLEELAWGLWLFRRWPTGCSPANTEKANTLMRRLTTVLRCLSSRMRRWIKIGRCSLCWMTWRRAKMRHRRRFLWPGCFARNRGSYRSQAAVIRNA